MAIASGARANARAFDRNQRKDIQGPESDRGDLARRPRTEDRGSLGNDNSGDPTKPEPGLLEQAEDFLTRTHKEIQAALSGTAQDITTPTERPGRNSNDERLRLLGAGAARPEEEEIIPGDPSNLGARGRRRRTEDRINSSPVLRRGLLGV